MLALPPPQSLIGGGLAGVHSASTPRTMAPSVTSILAPQCSRLNPSADSTGLAFCLGRRVSPHTLIRPSACRARDVGGGPAHPGGYMFGSLTHSPPYRTSGMLHVWEAPSLLTISFQVHSPVIPRCCLSSTSSPLLSPIPLVVPTLPWYSLYISRLYLLSSFCTLACVVGSIPLSLTLHPGILSSPTPITLFFYASRNIFPWLCTFLDRPLRWEGCVL